MAKTKHKEETKTIFDQEIDLQEQYSKAEHFVEDNKNTIMIVVGLIALCLIAYLAFFQLYIPNQEAEAQSEMFMAEHHFKNSEWQKVLDGEGDYPGVLDIIDSYSGFTKANNLAHYYAGISYLNLGDFDGAIDYLSKFKGKDEIIGSMALGALGDAYMEKGETGQGISYYEKAASNSKNSVSAPLFLMKAAAANEVEGNFKKAKDLYTRVKEDFPDSFQAREVDKYIDLMTSKL